jgi:cellulose biosynthesis protein BcsQ
VAQKGWVDLKVLPFFSMVDRRKALHNETIASMRERYPAILATEVPYGSQFERIAARRAPVEAYAPGSAATETYRQLWREIDSRLQIALGAPSATDTARVPTPLPVTTPV